MLRQRGSVSTGVVLALCLIGGLAWSLFGLQPKLPVAVETLHSSKPVLLYVFDGLAAHQKNWDATAAKKALVDSGLDAQVNKLLEFLAVESGQPAAQLSHKLLHQLISQGASISVTVSESNTQESDRAEPSGHPAFQVTLVLHGSASFAKPLNDLLLAGPLKDLNPKTETVAGRKVTRVVIPDSPGIEVGWWTEGGHLVIAGGMQGIEAALAVAQGQTANLTTNTFVQKLRASQAFDVAAVGLLDVKSLLDLARNIPIPATSPKNAPQTVGEIFKIVGIDGLGMFTGRWGFRDSALWSETTVEAKAPLTGIMASFDQSPITIAELPAIPATCEHFTLLRLDGAKIYGALLKSAKQGFEKFATPDMLPFEQWISHGNAVAGFDLKADLFDTLGDTVAFYTESGILVPSATLLVKLNDAAKFKQSLRLLQDKLKLAVNQFQDQVEFRTKESAGGRTIQIAQTKGQAFVSPSWVIDGDWLVLGTTPQAVEGYLKRVDGKLPRWKPTADLITAQKMLPEKFVSLSYSDPRGGIRSALSFAPSAIAFAEAGLVEWRKERLRAGPDANLTAEFPITPEDVPLAEEVTDPLFPNISVCTVDEKGIYWSTRNSIPGLPIPGIPGGSGGVESIAAVGVLAALLVPAVYKVREAAQRVESMNNLRRIGLALLNYGAAQRHFPAGTRPDDKIKNPEDRLSWLVDILPELEQQELQQTINEIGTHLDATNGTNLLYQLDGEPKHPDTIKRMIETIRLRIDPNGDWKIQIRPADKNQIELIIPRATPDEVEQIKSAVSASGRLEFCVLADKRNPEHRALIERAKDVQRDLVENKVVLAGWREVAPLTKKVNGKRTEVPNTDIESDSNLQFRQIKGRPDGFQEVLCVFEPKEDRRVTGKYLTRCTAERDQAGNPCVSFVLNPAGGARFGNLTTKYEPDSDGAKYHLAVLLNEIVQTAPTINQPIHTHGQITGNFTTAEVNLIVNILNSGALEVPLKRTPVSESATALPMGAKKGFSDAAYKKAFQHRLQVFVNPGQSLTLDPSGYAPTTYVGMAGVGKDAATLEIDDPKAGIFGYDRQTRVTDIKDGMSNTMLVTEVYQDFGPWGRGGRATIRGLTAKPYINGPDGIGRGKGSGGVHVLMADGSVRFISENIKPEVFEALATMAGGEDVGEF